jgi:altronate dehydratase
VRAGHLKPLGKPAQNARKWFSTVEIERMSSDSKWLDKAIRIVEKQIQEMNKKQRRKGAASVVVPWRRASAATLFY